MPRVRGARLEDREREAIIAALKTGASQNSVARKFGVDPATVNRIAKTVPDLQYCAPKKAIEARRDYAQATRLKTLNEAFAAVRRGWKKAEKPLEMQQLAMALAILIDKRRLEEGEATSRAEITHSAKDVLDRRLGELEARIRDEASMAAKIGAGSASEKTSTIPKVGLH